MLHVYVLKHLKSAHIVLRYFAKCWQLQATTSSGSACCEVRTMPVYCLSIRSSRLVSLTCGRATDITKCKVSDRAGFGRLAVNVRRIHKALVFGNTLSDDHGGTCHIMQALRKPRHASTPLKAVRHAGRLHAVDRVSCLQGAHQNSAVEEWNVTLSEHLQGTWLETCRRATA